LGIEYFWPCFSEPSWESLVFPPWHRWENLGRVCSKLGKQYLETLLDESRADWSRRGLGLNFSLQTDLIGLVCGQTHNGGESLRYP
jgi:hypothetical protein